MSAADTNDKTPSQAARVKLGLIALAVLALWSPAAASAYLPTLTIREARTFVEEINERADERARTESEVKRCYRVRRLQVNCREVDYCGPTKRCAGERINELLDRVTVTSRNRLRNSPVVLRWFF